MREAVRSKHIEGVTDLTLIAPLKQGFVPSLDTCSYETRLRRVLQTLHALRVASREASSTKPFSDTVDRIQSIHSFRVSILEPEKKVLLAVTFDHGWEPYIRDVWRRLGILIDIIFCNCDGYVTAYDHSYDEYAAWIRRSQLETNFFYAASGLSVSDIQFLVQTEKVYREGRDLHRSDIAATQLILKSAEESARVTAKADPVEAGDVGLAALCALYRLVDLYPSDHADGGFLVRAAHDLLQELRLLNTKVLFPMGSPKRERFAAQLDWFEKPGHQLRPGTSSPAAVEIPPGVQCGIVKDWGSPDQNMTHGCLLLMQVTDRDQACQFLRNLNIATEGSPPPADGLYCNAGFTLSGLSKLAVPRAELDKFPSEFREGMEERAGLLGDLRSNHPSNWKLPERNWRDPHDNRPGGAHFQLSLVDVVVQLRVSREKIEPGDEEITRNPRHPLYRRVAEISKSPGVRLLSVETMLNHHTDTEGIHKEHFGFCDGISQPVIGGAPDRIYWNDMSNLDDLLCDKSDDPKGPAAEGEDSGYLSNGSFMVIRKLRQNVGALNEFLENQLQVLRQDLPEMKLTRDDLLAKMMGRSADGTPLVENTGNGKNDFTYESDREGRKCPFQSHIRRANPRMSVGGKPVPRIARRSMSYGPRFTQENVAADRGLFFIAYNARIAEQFEVIQQWITGANSTVNSLGVYSGLSDPFLGVPSNGDRRTFRFMHGDDVVRIDLDSGEHPPFVELQWGLYLFVPSLPVLHRIAGSSKPHRESDEAAAGKESINRLLTMSGEEAVAEWKRYLEDPTAREDGETAAIWAAIRKHHSGVLRTPYGILTASASLVKEVFSNEHGRYSVKGYAERMRECIGEIYLGLDYGDDYKQWSTATNNAIMSIGKKEAFDLTRAQTALFLEFLLEGAKDETGTKEIAIDLKRDLSDLVLCALSRHWFALPDDLPDGPFVKWGGWDWDSSSEERLPRCPGDFTPPSRYLFSPNPGPAASAYGQKTGRLLRKKVTEFVKKIKADAIEPKAQLLNAIVQSITDEDRAARTIVGVMMGFLPTIDGCLRGVLYDWLKEKTFWRIQEDLFSSRETDAYRRAKTIIEHPLKSGMQARPVPNMVWRTAVDEHRLGDELVEPGDIIVVGIESATQEYAERGLADISPVFGGQRHANSRGTHACPAYSMSMGILMGVISALLEAGSIRPTAAPSVVILTGRAGD